MELWETASTLIPAQSNQAAWVSQRLHDLRARMGPPPEPPPPPPQPQWIRRLGPLAPVVLFLLKGKTLFFALFKLKFLLSLFAFLGIYISLYGWRFGLGFTALLFLHEMGHFVEVRRQGLHSEMPIFLPGLGAYVRWNLNRTGPDGQPVPITRRAYAQIALAGPLVGWFASALCYLIYTLTFDRLWAALAHTGAWLNLLNLIPVWLLDGSRAVTALGAVERAALLATTLGLWYYSGENVYFFVAAGVTWSLFAKDKPEHGDWNVWLAFVAILAAIGFLIHATPTHLFQ